MSLRRAKKTTKDRVAERCGTRTLPRSATGKQGRSAITQSAMAQRPLPRSRNFAVAKYDYAATQGDELSFQKGDHIRVVETAEGRWWKGECKEHFGWFPSDLVEEVQQVSAADKSTTSSTSSAITQSVIAQKTLPQSRDFAVAKYAFAAARDDELSFQKGDHIRIVETVEGGWWRGQCKEHLGWFPSSYVEEVLNQQVSAADKSTTSSATYHQLQEHSARTQSADFEKELQKEDLCFEVATHSVMDEQLIDTECPPKRQLFEGEISRDIAEAILKAEPRGSYLVRTSSRTGSYVLSVNAGDGMLHYQIPLSRSGKLVFDKKEFWTMNQMSQSLTKSSFKTPGGQDIQLRKDCNGFVNSDERQMLLNEKFQQAFDRGAKKLCEYLVQQKAVGSSKDTNEKGAIQRVCSLSPGKKFDERIDVPVRRQEVNRDNSTNGKNSFKLAMKFGHMSTACRLVLGTDTLDPAEVEDLQCLLQWACKNKEDAVAAKISSLTSSNGRTLFHYAAERAENEIIELLLLHNANANVVDKNGKRPFNLAMEQDHMSTAGRIVFATRILDPLDVQDLQQLLRWAHGHKKDELAREISSLTGLNGRTLLHYAAEGEAYEVVELLLNYKGNADAADKDGLKAITLALRTGHTSTACRLALFTSRLKNLPLEGLTKLLEWAVKNNESKVVTRIVEEGIESLKDHSSRTALHYAAQLGSKDVVDYLLRKKLDAAVVDMNGKRPYQLASDQVLRKHLKKAIDEQKYAVLYAKGKRRLDTIKLCVVGKEGSGKTTFLNALQRRKPTSKENQADDPFCEEERTLGINVVTAEIPGVGRLLLWDYAGQDQFHKTHGVFFSASNSFFIVLVSLLTGQERRPCSIEELTDVALYWLRFLRASFDKNFIPTVLLVASRGDICLNGQSAFRQVVRHMQELFKGKINICDRWFVLDGRKCSSAEMKEIRGYLRDVRDHLAQLGDLYPELCLPVVKEVLPSLRKSRKDPFIETRELIDIIESKTCRGQDKNVLEKVIDFIHDRGEVVCVSGITALNIQWLCQYIIGPLMASEHFRCHMRRKRKDGTVTKCEIEKTLQEYFAANNIKIALNVDTVITLLEALFLAFKVEGKQDTYMFPAHLPGSTLSRMWLRESDKKVYVGRRCQCCSETSMFSPTLFNVFQCKACVTLDRQALLWKEGLIITTKNAGPFQIQCLVVMTRPLGAVDFVVRGTERSDDHCSFFLTEVLSLWTDVIEEYSAGTEYETRYLSKKILVQHRNEMDSYTEEQVKQAKEAGRDGQVQYSTDQENFTENVRDLMVFPRNRQKISQLDRAVARHGSAKWYELGRELGLTCDEIQIVIYDKPDNDSKVFAIIDHVAKIESSEKTEQLVLNACKSIGIIGDVARELDDYGQTFQV